MIDQASGIAPRWRSTLTACLTTFLILLALFWSTAQGMAYIWYNFETYTHGFLILPISLWLLWQKRRHLAAFSPQPTPAFLVFVLAGLGVWVLARLTGVQVVEQLAFVGIVVASFASLLGWQVSKFLAFPLLFLFFAVPMGEDLVPPMMEFTATFTVEALRLTGIPVYRDGLWFSLPSGNWSVVEACSGVRYLIASATLGVMYAYITYHTLWKRLLFIALSIVVPILANGVRAYMIVMIGHLSSMEYATGVDHLIYGWVFFGVVMFILFWIGSIWQEHDTPPVIVAPPRAMSDETVGRRVWGTAFVAILAAVGTVWGTHMAKGIESQVMQPLSPPAGANGWVLQQDPVAWQSAHQPTSHVVEAFFAKGEDRVQLYVVLFPQQRQGAEAINQDNKIAADLVRQTSLGAGEVEMGERRVAVNRARAIVRQGAGSAEHLVWQWYRVAGHSLINRYEGKAWEALARLYPGRADGAWIAITTPLDEREADAAAQRLSDFARSMAPQIDAAIDASLGIAE